MEAAKSHNLPSPSWKPRKTRGLVPVQAWRPENQGSQWWHLCPSLKAWTPENQEYWCPKRGKDGYLSTSKESELALHPPFVLRCSSNWMVPTHVCRASPLFSLLAHMVISPRDTFTDTPKSNVLPAVWASPDPVRLTHTINHHRAYQGSFLHKKSSLGCQKDKKR